MGNDTGAGSHENGQYGAQSKLEDGLEPIAVIGYSLRFPQDATSSDTFWKLLLDGSCTSTTAPEDRFNHEAFYNRDPNSVGTTNSRGCHFVRGDIAEFDAPFFSITPTEAACMDPQQRILLETAYRALENSGLPTENVFGTKTSVTIGSFTTDYNKVLDKDSQTSAKYISTGNEAGMLANRLSWFWDLSGPSMQIDTACSSSLVALHIACQGLRHREADMGLVGGCNLVISPETLNNMSDLNLLSPDGISYSFDSRANGYARGEGFGMVVIKLLSKAIADGDTIRAIIRATGTNQDGKTSVITQPSANAQANLIRDTYAKANLDLGLTRFFEAHGTGTPVGDPIEATAINEVFGAYRSATDPLIIGAVKSNIGHLEGASGIAGLIKTILVLEKGIIPPNTNFDRVNPKIPLGEWNIAFPRQATPWPASGLRRASINSFGFGGTNAHAIVEDAYHYLKQRNIPAKHCTAARPLIGSGNDLQTPDIANLIVQQCTKTRSVNGHTTGKDIGKERSASSGKGYDYLKSRLFVFSSMDKSGIARLADVYDAYVLRHQNRGETEGFLRSLAYTLAKKRSQLPWKSYVIRTANNGLQLPLHSAMSSPVRSTQTPSLGFVFTGQGAQWGQMGRELFEYPVFRESMEAADHRFRLFGSEWSLIDELHKHQSVSRLSQPRLSQPVCTALQVAIVQLLQSWNISPNAVIGHSSGEIAAAYASGSITAETAWKIAYYRGLVIEKRLKPAKSGFTEGMMSVGLSENDVLSAMTEEFGPHAQRSVTVACVNSPKNVTLSGDAFQLEALQTRFTQQGVFARKLNVDTAYHSSSMESVASEYQALLRTLHYEGSTGASRSYYSSLTGKQAYPGQLQTPSYWVDNLTKPVLFSQALQEMCSSGKNNGPAITHLLEIGPHSALRLPVKETLVSMGTFDKINYNAVMRRNGSALETILTATGDLYCRGYPVDISKVNDIPESSIPQMLVDGPDYPFNHEQRYWIESSLSRNFRFRKWPEHELLGVTVPDWNILDARWRKIIRLADNKWIADHVVDGGVLYPGAGMVMMAIEAAKYLADPARTIVRYRVENVRFSKAIFISSDSAQVEVEMTLQPIADLVTRSSTWREFRLFVNENDEWFESCRGTVIVEYEDNECASHYLPTEDGWKPDGNQSSIKSPVSPSTLYKDLSDAGLEYGPLFQVLNKISVDKMNRKVAGQISPCNWRTDLVEGDPRRLVIHPTAVDGIFQLIALGLANHRGTKTSAMLPTRLDSVWVTASGIYDPQSNGGTAIANVSATWEGVRTARSDATVLDSSTSTVAMQVSGLHVTAVESQKALEAPALEQLCYKIKWMPDIDLLGKHGIEEYCNSKVQQEQTTKSVETLELGALIFIMRFLQDPGDVDIKDKPHLQRYLDWMKGVAKRESHLTLRDAKYRWADIMNDSQLQNKILDEIVSSGVVQGRVISGIGRRLHDIMNGRVDALQALFQDDNLIHNHLEAQLSNPAVSKLQIYLELMAHKNPSLSVLEVGAGMGATTRKIVQALTRNGSRRTGTAGFIEYTFTDTSASSFEKAQDIFKGLEHRARYKTLNLDEDAFTQGFDGNAYDLVIATNTLHATKSISESLDNIRKLLKPGGKLILIELTVPESIRATFVWGTLPRWWSGTEESRKSCPLLTSEMWQEALRDNGFAELEFNWPDHPESSQRDISVIIATTTDPITAITQTSRLGNTLIVIEESEYQRNIANDIIANINPAEDGQCSVALLDDLSAEGLTSERVIFLCELERPLLFDMGERFFSALRNIIQTSESLLWVTSGNYGIAKNPHFKAVVGLARTMRSEGKSTRFASIAVDASRKSVSALSETISNAHKLTANAQPEDFEAEFEDRQGILYINRIIEDHVRDDIVSRRMGLQGPKSSKLSEDSSRRLTLAISTPGQLETLHFDDPDGPVLELAPDEVEVEIKASGLSRRDVLIAEGLHNDTHFGLEFAGVVSRRGSDVSLDIGDLIFGWAHSTFGTHTRCKVSTTARIPAHLTFETAASIPVAFCTAYYALVELARIQSGKSVLIHSAASGVGQAAVQLAKSYCAEIFTTVDNDEQRELLKSKYQIPEDNIFSSRSSDFQPGIERCTKSRGVDIILNSLTDEDFIATTRCLAPFGVFVEIGHTDKGSINVTDLKMNGMFAVANPSHMLRHGQSLLEYLMANVIKLFDRDTFFELSPLTVYPVSQIEQAFRLLQGRDSTGKIVVSFDPQDMAQIKPSSVSNHYFKSDATYVVVGGLGGIGRSVCRWMVSRGAQNLLLLSRSKQISNTAQQLVDELVEQGARVVTSACDVGDRDALDSVLRQYDGILPPIKGCIHSAMALKDVAFDDMTLSQFDYGLRPKVAGSYNLHRLLPEDLDFFVMLSSGAGINGATSQANYAVGNVYQDNLARHRVRHGQRAHAIDLGIVEGVGFTAERHVLTNYLRNLGHGSVSEAEILALLDHCCDPHIPLTDPDDAQIVTGIRTVHNLSSHGMPEPTWMDRPLFRHPRMAGRPTTLTSRLGGSAAKKGEAIRAAFAAATSLNEAIEIVRDALIVKLSNSLAVPVTDIDANKPTHTYGIDSLSAVDLRNWLLIETKVEMPIFQILGNTSIAEIAALVGNGSELLSDAAKENKEGA